MTIRKQINGLLAKLGFTDKVKAGLSDEELQQVTSEYKALYNTDLKEDLAKMKDDEEKAAAFTAIKEALKGVAAEEETGEDEEPKSSNPNEDPDKEEEEQPSAEAAEVVKQINKVLSDNKALKEENEKMARQAQEDKPEATVRPARALAGMTTATHLFGIEHDMFSLDKVWNKITAKGSALMESYNAKKVMRDLEAAVSNYGQDLAARMKELQSMGMLNIVALTTEGTIDYSGLSNANLGDQYVVRRMDALIAQILMLPNLTDIFPMRSNIQDKELLTNAFFGEFSQSYQPGEISKGSMELQPEVATVFDVMFKYLFESFKWIERTYLGYLNTSGSDPVKWNLIEWMILRIAQALRNEQNTRLILGHRIEPVKGENASYMFASTGLVHKIFDYVSENKLLPMDDAVYNNYTKANIGDAMEAFVEDVADVYPLEVKNFTLYINSKHKAWYKAWYRTKYGRDLDFTGPQLTLEEHEVPIKFIPNMGNLKLMLLTQPGNFQTLEDKPGEMFKVAFEQHLEAVWSWSNWKEGISATFVGKTFKDRASLVANNYANQLIFINYPVTEVAADATTVDGRADFLFRTCENSKATAITDITNAKAGVVYRIECGSITNATTIAKADKFADLTDVWNPTAVGDWIKVYYNATTQKFVEVARS
ncbi:MAG: hypothetical protein E7122_02735 [Bacteroidales bacterium]|nr:hypothetical protein [Bacteroidales bacterium]